MQKPQARPAPGKIMWMPVLWAFLLDTVITGAVVMVGSLADPTLAQSQNSSWATPAAVIVWILSIVSTGIAGWFAARRARHERVLHGVLVGALGLGMSLLTMLTDETVIFNGLDVALIFLAIGAGALGGYLSRWLPTRQEDV